MTARGNHEPSLGSTLERLLFPRGDQAVVRKLRAPARTEDRAQSLSGVTGITDPQILQKLAELQRHPALAASLPVLPLAEMAWADEGLDERETKAVLTAAAGCGIPEGSLAHALLENWLAAKPPKDMFAARTQYVQELCEFLGDEDRRVLRDAVMTRVRSVAEASGGFLGFAAKISRQEAAMLARLEAAFARRP